MLLGILGTQAPWQQVGHHRKNASRTDRQLREESLEFDSKAEVPVWCYEQLVRFQFSEELSRGDTQGVEVLHIANIFHSET